MEPLEQALNKARQQRQNRGGHFGHRVAPDDVAQRVVYSETASMPMDERALELNRIVSNKIDHEVTDVFRSLRARILQRLGNSGATTLGITSLTAGEGKTMLAINLAIAISMDVNQTVLLVDTDLRNPSVAQYMGLPVDRGLGDILGGQASIQETMINPGLSRLCILPAHDCINNSAELLSSPRMLRIVRELKERYTDRLIIFDLPPLLTVADTIGFLPLVEATLLVVRDGTVPESDLKRMLVLLRGHNLIGTVLNAA